MPAAAIRRRLTVKLNPAALAQFIEKHNNGQSILGDFGLDDAYR
ncbi:MAG: hypothetical protein U0Y68_12000 [Blastocatellia bacterium]